MKNMQVQAIAWILLCKMSFLAAMTTLRYLPYPPLQTNFMRALLVMSTIGLYLLIKRELSLPKGGHLSLHSLRLIAGSLSAAFTYYAYDHLSLNKASVILFANTLVVPILGAVFLQEIVTPRRWVVLAIGYIGLYIAINPLYGDFEFAEFIALLAAITMAITVICARKLSSTTPPLLLLFYAVSMTSLLMSVYFLFDIPSWSSNFKSWQPVITKHVGFILLMAFFDGLSQFAFLRAYSLTTVSFLSPFDYSKFVFALIGDFLFWQILPQPFTWIGAALIIVSTYYITYHDLLRSECQCLESAHMPDS